MNCLCLLVTGVDLSQAVGGITMVLFPSNTDYARHHGVVRLDSEVSPEIGEH